MWNIRRMSTDAVFHVSVGLLRADRRNCTRTLAPARRCPIGKSSYRPLSGRYKGRSSTA